MGDSAINGTMGRSVAAFVVFAQDTWFGLWVGTIDADGVILDLCGIATDETDVHGTAVAAADGP